ncbi:MAG: lytic transglycosylase domain-containing protein [Alphaproteobacteria bacterium]
MTLQITPKITAKITATENFAKTYHNGAFRVFSTILFLMGVLCVLGSHANIASASPYGSNAYSKAEIQAIIVQEANQNKVVPPALALGVAQIESNFNPKALSSAGARGVMQIMPATARGEFNVSADVLYDPLTNIRIGILYLERLYRQYNQNWEHALSHYNGGTLKRKNGRHVAHSYTAGYVQKVMNASFSFASADTKNMLGSALDRHQQQASSTGQARINQNQAAAMSLLLHPETDTHWQDYLLAADQFLDPENAAAMPIRKKFTAGQKIVNFTKTEAYQQDPRFLEKAKKYQASNAPNGSRSAAILNQRNQFRTAFLNKIN